MRQRTNSRAGVGQWVIVTGDDSKHSHSCEISGGVLLISDKSPNAKETTTRNLKAQKFKNRDFKNLCLYK